MKLLVVGSETEGTRLLSNLCKGNGHTITHCADGARVVAELGSGLPEYDGIVVQGEARTLSSMEIASAIRAMGVWIPIMFLSDVDGLGFGRRSGERKCHRHHGATDGVELMHDVVRDLNEGRRSGSVPPGQSRPESSVIQYHAPIKKRRAAAQ